MTLAGPVQLVKKGQSYLLVQSRTMRFLDLCHFLPMGRSYRDVVKMFLKEDLKSFFPSTHSGLRFI